MKLLTVVAAIITNTILLAPLAIAFQTPMDGVEKSKSALSNSPENEIVEREYLRTESSGAHCGVYSVAAAIHAIGGNVDVKELMQSQYISQSNGSTAADVVRMIEDAGYEATVINRLNGSSLAYSNSPIIVHLDGLRRVEKSHHWVCFLGIKDGKPLLFDPPNPAASVGYGDILAFTSGVGIVVSKEKPGREALWFGKLEMLFWGGVCVVLVGTASLFHRRGGVPRIGTHSFTTELALFSLAVVVVIGVQQLMPWANFLRDPVSLAHFQEMYAEPVKVAEIDYDYVANGVRDKCLSIIDARLPTAFGFGHLPGATNWPVDASTIESRKAYQSLDTTKAVVVYCESDRCVWSDVIASRLKARGVREVYVYRGGYQEWQLKSK